MGEFKAPNGTRSFEPDDTDTEFYIASNFHGTELGLILERARAKWGEGIVIDDILIEPEYIHTECLGHDQYDSGDYTRYLRIEYTGPVA